MPAKAVPLRETVAFGLFVELLASVSVEDRAPTAVGEKRIVTVAVPLGVIEIGYPTAPPLTAVTEKSAALLPLNATLVMESVNDPVLVTVILADVEDRKSVV